MLLSNIQICLHTLPVYPWNLPWNSTSDDIKCPHRQRTCTSKQFWQKNSPHHLQTDWSLQVQFCVSFAFLQLEWNKKQTPSIFEIIWEEEARRLLGWMRHWHGSNYWKERWEEKVSYPKFLVLWDPVKFIFLFLNFDWSLVDLQCCVSFRGTAKGTSYIYIIYPFLYSFPIQVITEHGIEFLVLYNRSL